MSFFRRFRKRNEIEKPLWEDGDSIYQHISENLEPTSGRIKKSAYKLPDEEKRFKPGELRFGGGSLDGIFVYHIRDSNSKLAPEVAKLIHVIAKTGSYKSKLELYRILENDNLLWYIDESLEKAIGLGISADPYLHDFAKLLSTTSPDRGAVKFGISILGLIGDSSDLEIIRTLGKHDEFTLYCAVAISNFFKNPEAELFNLAQTVDGWGRIHLVERLVQTEDTTIKNWLIREGYKNRIMNEYLAYSCAVAGDLHQRIANQFIDEELFDSSGDIITALINGGPAEDIHDYEHAAVLINGYLKHFNHFSRNLYRYLVLRSIHSYLSDEDWDESNAADCGWSEDLRTQALRIIKDYSDQREWIELANQGLSSNDQATFEIAELAAQHLGIDTWKIHWERLNADPLNPSNWYQVMSQVDETRIDEIIIFAMKILPLDKIATGPAEEHGLGPSFEAHSCLQFILQGLRQYPRKGEKLIIAGLASPVISNRNFALRALSFWAKSDRSDELNRALREALSAEPSDNVRANIRKVLDGEEIE